MEKEKKELKSTVTICKNKGYSFHKIILPLDKDRSDDFNKMKNIEVTKEELKAIGEHRWLEIKNGR